MALLVFALLSGCAHVAPECSLHGGTPWRELTSQHFVVQTNLAAADARAATMQLEQARASLLSALPSGGSTPSLEVIVFASAAQLQDLSGEPWVAATLTHDWRGALLLTANASSFLGTRQLQLTLHELAHHYSSAAFRRWPRWFEEGLATYLETIVIDADAKSARRGVAHQLKLGEVMRWGILPVQSLWAWDVELDEHNGLEQHRAASAWFWVHFLFNEHRSELDRFMRALSAGDEPRAAWASTFGDVAVQKMADEAAAYIERRETKSQLMDLSQLNTAVVERAVPDAEVHAILARAAAATGAWPRAGIEARAALAIDPRDARVREQDVVTQASPEARLSAARALTEAAPTLAAGWLLLGLALPAEDPARGQALEKAVDLEPKSALALSELAAFRCSEGRCSEGVPFAETAVNLAPGESRIHAGAASVLLKSGQCARAVSGQQRALEVLSHRAAPALRKQLQTRLAEYQRCH